MSDTDGGPTPENPAHKLRDLMEALDLTPTALAVMVGMDRSSPGKWLNGDPAPPQWLLQHLGTILALRAICRGAFPSTDLAEPAPLPGRLEHLAALAKPPRYATKGYETSENMASIPQAVDIIEGMESSKAQMTPAEFLSALAVVEFRQADFARHVGAATSTVYKWAAGKAPIPAWVPVVLELIRQVRGLAQLVQPPRERKGLTGRP